MGSLFCSSALVDDVQLFDVVMPVSTQGLLIQAYAQWRTTSHRQGRRSSFKACILVALFCPIFCPTALHNGGTVPDYDRPTWFYRQPRLEESQQVDILWAKSPYVDKSAKQSRCGLTMVRCPLVWQSVPLQLEPYLNQPEPSFSCRF